MYLIFIVSHYCYYYRGCSLFFSIQSFCKGQSCTFKMYWQNCTQFLFDDGTFFRGCTHQYFSPSLPSVCLFVHFWRLQIIFLPLSTEAANQNANVNANNAANNRSAAAVQVSDWAHIKMCTVAHLHTSSAAHPFITNTGKRFFLFADRPTDIDDWPQLPPPPPIDRFDG